MGLRDSFMAGLAGQLGRPSGLAGRLVIAGMLNRGNRTAIAAAADALELDSGAVAADVGFGGGVGLGLLLDRVGPTGRVHGVDISPEMVSRAAARYRRELHRLTLHPGSVTALPIGDATIDGAICLNVIYFVDDLDKVFGELARILAPSGRLVLGVGDPTMMAAMPFTRHGFRIRPVRQLADGLAAAGLPVKEQRRIGSTERGFHLLIAGRPQT